MAEKKKHDTGKQARRVARKVVGIVPATRVETPKPERKVKHKKPLQETD